MSNAKKLYDGIVDLNYVNARMIGQSFENTWFDCKQKHDATNGRLDKDDKSNLAKALSGFANMSGGVLIFGLDARKINGIDMIQGLVPIKDLRVFESELREAESRIVERPIPGLEYRKIYTDEPTDTGIIIIYIPEGPNSPYRSLVDKQFYQRAGDSFIPLTLSQIECLVQKNRKPDLELSISIVGNSSIKIGTEYSFSINFQIENIGKTVAKNVLLELRIGVDIYLILQVAKVFIQDYEKKRNSDGDYIYAWRYGEIIHPEEIIQLPNFQFLYKVDGPVGCPLLLEASVYAENMSKRIHSINIDPKDFFFGIMPNGKYLLTQGKDFIVK